MNTVDLADPNLPIWLAVGLLVWIAILISIYVVHRRNKRFNRPPKIWAAVLLSFLTAPVGGLGGLLYVDGIIPTLALAAFIIVSAAVASNPSLAIGFFVLPLAFATGMRARHLKRTSNKSS